MMEKEYIPPFFGNKEVTDKRSHNQLHRRRHPRVVREASDVIEAHILHADAVPPKAIILQSPNEIDLIP
jgi:hypothetical protein